MKGKSRKKRSKPPEKSHGASALAEEKAAATNETQDADASVELKAEKAADAGKPEADTDEESVDQLKDRLLRLQADFDHFRKRTLREKSAIYRNANEDFMLALLPVLDHLELALNAVAEHGADEAFLEGFKLVSDQMISILERFGLNSIDAVEGAFDPNLHEAISHLPSETVPANEIVTQVRRGYRLGERVLRAAQVVVSSGTPRARDDDDKGTNDVGEATSVAVDDDTSED